MKELTIEQKAKAYDDAIERTRNLYNSEETSSEVMIACENIFPELFETEDERIERLLHSISNKMSFHLHDIFTEEEFQCFDAQSNAWLEKQVEQTPVDKVEPKFKVGDWVVNEVTGSVCQIKYCIENLQTHKYGYELTNGCYVDSYGANHYHLWTIKDAKDGDVLISLNNNPFIYNGFHNHYYIGSYGGILVGNGFCVANETCNWTLYGNVHPATKEQRDTLLKAMTDAGYEFNFETKELKYETFTV